MSLQSTAGLSISSQRLQLILDAQADLAGVNFNLDRFMETVVLRMQSLTGATGAVVELAEGEHMVYRAASGSVKDYVGTRLLRKGSLSGMCVDQQTLMISHDTSVDPRVDKVACKKVGAASMMVVPLMRQDHAVGVLKIASTKANAFQEYDVQTLRLMGGVLGSLLGQQMETKDGNALYDSLTGLPTRAVFMDRLSQALNAATRRPGMLAAFCMDLDHFQAVNDAHGRTKGDALLQLFAARIVPFLRNSDMLVRIDDDEFGVLMEGAGAIADVEAVAAHVIEAARAPFHLGEVTATVGASIGIATVQGIPTSPEHVLKRATDALLAAKTHARGTFHLSSAA